VKNMSKNGDHYWVFAHVTPTFDEYNQVLGYHSSRRVPERNQVELFDGVYRQLLEEEQRHADWRSGMEAAERMLLDIVARKGMQYEEFVFSV
jgi:hypothetical protein